MPISFSGRFGRGKVSRIAKSATVDSRIGSTTNGSPAIDGAYTVVTYTGTTNTEITISSNSYAPPSGSSFPSFGRESSIGSVKLPTSFDVLVVGGGMSGAGGHSPGGHGGGAVEDTISIGSPTTYALTVGAGSATPGNGSSSQSSSNPSTGFGVSIPGIAAPASDNTNFYGYNLGSIDRAAGGGNGGGPARNTYGPTEGPVAGSSVPGGATSKTRRGGNGLYSQITGSGVYYGGGGGGAGGNGYETSQGGKGGFGGGGGGGTGPGGAGGEPGTPAGGYGSPTGPAGGAGASNTGGGGGSGGINNCGSVYCAGRAGGSGVVIIRYLTAT